MFFVLILARSVKRGASLMWLDRSLQAEVFPLLTAAEGSGLSDLLLAPSSAWLIFVVRAQHGEKGEQWCECRRMRDLAVITSPNSMRS